MTKISTFSLLFAAITDSHAFLTSQSSPTIRHATAANHPLYMASTTNDDVYDFTGLSSSRLIQRRSFFQKAAAAAAVIPVLSPPLPAHASGGATAGKYTTIPIAKRRYYGRVQEAVHEFLLMAPAMIKGDMTDPTVQVSNMGFIEFLRYDVD